MDIDHEIISTAIPLPFTDSRKVDVSYKRKYVHKVLVNYLVKVKLIQEKVWLGELRLGLKASNQKSLSPLSWLGIEPGPLGLKSYSLSLNHKSQPKTFKFA